MGDEHLDTTLAIASDEFIKSSIENLVPNLKSLLNHDSSIISSSLKIDYLFDEFADELTLLKSISSRINKTDCDPKEETRLIKRLLYDNSSPRPPKEFISENSDTAFESFSLFPILVKDSDSFMEEIDLSFTSDDPMPSGIEKDDHDSEMDMLILEELLTMIPLHFLKMSHFILIFLHPLVILQNHRMKPTFPLLFVLWFCMSIIPGNEKTHTEGFCPPVFISSASLGNHVS
nr:hypothetical protein [Tanacetum cinerariifolium]